MKNARDAFFEVFGLKSPIELERLGIFYPKNMEWYSKETLFIFYWAKRKTTIWVICANVHIELTAAERFVFRIFHRSIQLWVQCYSYITFILFADTERIKVTK